MYMKTSSNNVQKSRKYDLLNPQKGVMRIYRKRYDQNCEIHKRLLQTEKQQTALHFRC